MTTFIEEKIKEFKKKFPHLYDDYIDREIPGSMSEGENLESFLSEALNEALKNQTTQLRSKIEKMKIKEPITIVFMDKKEKTWYANGYKTAIKDILSLLSSQESICPPRQNDKELEAEAKKQWKRLGGKV